MKGKAWAPGHLTGFFEVHMKQDPVNSGSRGAGINIDKGVKAFSKVKESSKNEIKAPGISKKAIERLLKKLDKKYKIRIKFKREIPPKTGFGSSGAEALSSLLAVKEALNLPLTQNKIVEIAHKTEVENKTGLGDVVPQAKGGVVIRKKEGGPSEAETDKIPTREKKLYFYVFGPITTSKIINSKNKIKKLNKIGKNKRKKLLKKPTLENFFITSKKFAIETRIGKKRTLKILKETNKRATITMIGDAIVSKSPIKKIRPKKSFKAKISTKGIQIL